MERFSVQKISKDVAEFNNIINQLAIMDIYRLLQAIITEYTFFSCSHGIFIKTGHILGHETHLNKGKRRKIFQCLSSDHNGIQLHQLTKR